MQLIGALQIQSVFIYVSMGSEADTKGIIQALYPQMPVFVPYTAEKTMQSVRLPQADDLFVDRMGNLSKAHTYTVGQASAAVVPLLACNRALYRVGYGGGYYDAYLSRFKGHTIGLAYDEQITEFLPESHDIPLEFLVTPTQTIRRKNG